MGIFTRNAGAVLVAGALLGIGSGAMASEYRQNEVLVKFKANAVRTRMTMSSFYSALGVKTAKRFGGMMKGVEQLILNDGVSVKDAIAALRKNSLVEYAQPNYIVHTLPVTDAQMKAAGERAKSGLKVPGFSMTAPAPAVAVADVQGRPDLQARPADVNPPEADPALDKDYGLKNIGAIDAWNEYKGDSSFLVADVDTGIDYNHEDLAFNIWRNPNPTQNDVVGFDFIHNDGLPFDDNMHGTHTAGTIGAVGGNGKGISGVAERVSLMSVKFLDSEGSGAASDAVKAIDYAVSHGARVLNNSWGGAVSPSDPDNRILKDAVDRARDKGVLFVAAAGNDSVDNDGDGASFPASFDDDNVISVAAVDDQDQLAFFSNYGARTVQLAAPGTNVYSTIPGNQYKEESGTSMACPHVTGAAALIWASNPNMDYKAVKKALLDSVDPIPGLNGKVSTGGRLNVLKALKRVRNET